MKYRMLIVAATLIWGSSFVIVKDSTSFMDPAWIIALRFLTAAVVLGLFLLKKRSLFFKKEYVLIGLLFGLAMFFAYYVQTLGIVYTTPGKNAFLTGVYCVLVPFFAWIGLKKRPNRFNISAALVCLVGVGFVSLGNESGVNVGDLLTLLCAVFYAIHIVLVSKFSQGRDIYVLTMWQFAGVGVFALITAVVLGKPVPALMELAPSQLGSLAYLALACTLVALLFQNIGQKHLPASSASLLLSLESPFGVFFSVLLGAEDLSAKIFIGFALIFAAVVISEVLPSKFETKRSQGEEQVQAAA